MIINEKTKTIELTADEMKKARNPKNEDEYNDLQKVRHDYPGFRVIQKTRRKSKSALVKLDLATIESYVNARGNDQQKRDLSNLLNVSFFVIKKWFFEQFPEVKEFTSYSQIVMAMMGCGSNTPAAAH